MKGEGGPRASSYPPPGGPGVPVAGRSTPGRSRGDCYFDAAAAAFFASRR
jgi:hypothetical protein